MNDNIYCCKPLEDNSGYTWTIVSRLGDIFSEMEKLFGPRDKSYTILGIEIAQIEQPQCWFPKYDGQEGNVIIQITPNCLNDIGQAIYQVAHESVHCLTPKTFGHVNWLEEGMATWFSKYYTSKLGLDFNPTVEKYRQALSYVEELFKYDKNIIRTIRINHEPDLSKITSDLLFQVCPQIDKDLAVKLADQF